ncbi:FtsH protease activity modulator HflK [SAR86 cluster bacterium]|nr:FtsH protease activity modulator HflK [SAR86 cluster bacterium]MDC3151226.1 FtsH protease activity modulator HflK [SAR86 cluster bacterium]
MSWNDNGKNGSRDPWGNKNDAPDIDEAIKKFKSLIGSFVGGSGGGDSSGSSPSFKKILPTALVVLIVLYSALGIYTVDAQEEAVILRFGKYSTTKGPGIHWNPPFIDNRFIVNTEKLFTHTTNSSILTKDENIVNVETAVQYKRSNPVFYLLEAASPEDSIAQASESALRHVVGSNSMDNVLTTGREQIAIDVRKRLQERLNAYFTGIEVVTVSIRESRPPEAVREAFDDVVKAREDEVTLRNEAETYANEVVPIARGAAKRAIQDAEGYKAKVIAEAEGEATRFDQLLKEYSKAPDVTRKRLYIDAVQSVMSNSTKVMIDVKDGNNIMMLPLDQVAAASIARSNQNTEVETDSGALSGTAIQNLTDQVIEEIRKRQERR